MALRYYPSTNSVIRKMVLSPLAKPKKLTMLLWFNLLYTTLIAQNMHMEQYLRNHGNFFFRVERHDAPNMHCIDRHRRVVEDFLVHFAKTIFANHFFTSIEIFQSAFFSELVKVQLHAR